MESILILAVFIAIVFAYTNEFGIVVSDLSTSSNKVIVLFKKNDRTADSPYKYEIALCYNCIVYIWLNQDFFELCTVVFGIIVEMLIEEIKQK